MYDVLFQYGPLTVTTYNALLGISFIISSIFFVRYVQLKKMKLSFFVNNFVYFLLIPLLAGRIFLVIEHFSAFKDNLVDILTIWDMKFSSFGIFYGGILTLVLLSRREREDLWAWLDAFALSGLACLFFTHIGNFFDGSHFGRPTGLPWGIAFDTFNIPFTTPIHPVQLYSAFVTFIIIAIFVRTAKRTHLTGVASNLGIMLYCIAAFGLNFLHGAPSTYNKINYAIIAAVSFIYYIHCSHKKLFKWYCIYLLILN